MVTLHGTRLVRSLAAAFLDRELAADAAQEAFVQLYLHWDKVMEGGDPALWLYRVAMNRGRDYRRALARAARLFEHLTTGLASGPAAGSTEESPTPEWIPRADFLRILEQLPARQRAVAALFYDADLSIGDIAACLGISTGAVHSHLHRARQALREILEAER